MYSSTKRTYSPLSPGIFSFAPISKEVQNHLKNVYLTLSVTLLCATLGVLAHLKFFIGASFFTILATFGCLIGFAVSSASQENFIPRLAFLLGFAFFDGAVLGPLVQLAAMIQPHLILVALGATTLIFTCFSLSAIFSSPERKYLFYGGILSSAISMLFWFSVINMFFPTELGLNIQLYGGLIVFLGYILYDTQLIILKREAGDTDYLSHSVELFIDFVAVFVRLLIILLKNAQNRKERSSR